MGDCLCGTYATRMLKVQRRLYRRRKCQRDSFPRNRWRTNGSPTSSSRIIPRTPFLVLRTLLWESRKSCGGPILEDSKIQLIEAIGQLEKSRLRSLTLNKGETKVQACVNACFRQLAIYLLAVVNRALVTVVLVAATITDVFRKRVSTARLTEQFRTPRHRHKCRRRRWCHTDCPPRPAPNHPRARRRRRR